MVINIDPLDSNDELPQVESSPTLKSGADPTEFDDGFQEKDLIKCPNCDRTFLPHRLELHLRGCKPDRPLGRIVRSK